MMNRASALTALLVNILIIHHERNLQNYRLHLLHALFHFALSHFCEHFLVYIISPLVVQFLCFPLAPKFAATGSRYSTWQNPQNVPVSSSSYLQDSSSEAEEQFHIS